MDRNMEMLLRAKDYLGKLAGGTDPISGEELPEDAVLNQVRISRCFFFVADVLQKVIDNGGEVQAKRAAKPKRLPFELPHDRRAQVPLSDEPIAIKQFCDAINSCVDLEEYKHLKVTAFGKWLAEKGFFTIEVHNDKNYKKVTPAGFGIGMLSEHRTYGTQEYDVTLYTRQAQQFLLDNLDEIAAVSNGTAQDGVEQK